MTIPERLTGEKDDSWEEERRNLDALRKVNSVYVSLFSKTLT